MYCTTLTVTFQINLCQIIILFNNKVINTLSSTWLCSILLKSLVKQNNPKKIRTYPPFREFLFCLCNVFFNGKRALNELILSSNKILCLEHNYLMDPTWVNKNVFLLYLFIQMKNIHTLMGCRLLSINRNHLVL